MLAIIVIQQVILLLLLLLLLLSSQPGHFINTISERNRKREVGQKTVSP